MKINKTFKNIFALSLVAILTACGGGEAQVSNENLDLNSLSLTDLEEKARAEGRIETAGMPRDWANWGDTYDQMKEKYGIEINDTYMTSAEELAMFEAEKNDATKDIGDVGQSYGPVAVDKGVALPYKTSYWDDIPDWAKDHEGNYIVAYYGTICAVTNLDQVEEAPESWEDILAGDYKVTLGDVTTASQAQNTVLSAAMSKGGDESNIDPGIGLFRELAEAGRLDTGNVNVQRLESGEIQVGMFFDFNAINFVNAIKERNPNANYAITILQDGAAQSGYTTIINKYSKRPHAAALLREYILSDQGQINLAKGYARPIRDNVEIPADIKEKFLDDELYKNAKPIEDVKAWEATTKTIGEKWQNEVITNLKN